MKKELYLVIATNTSEGLQIGISMYTGGNFCEYGGNVIGNSDSYEGAVAIAERFKAIEENSYICYNI